MLFIVRDLDGQALAYCYFEEEPGRRSAAKLLTRDGTQRTGSQLRQAARFVATSRNAEVGPATTVPECDGAWRFKPEEEGSARIPRVHDRWMPLLSAA